MDFSLPEVTAGIGGVLTATKAVVSAVKDLKSPPKALLAAISTLETEALDLKQTVLDLKTEALKLGEENLSLRRENSELREQVRAHERRALEGEQYHLKIVGQATVVVKDDNQDIHYCSACWAKSRVAIPLQALPRPMIRMGTHYCPNCKANIHIHS